MGVTMGTMGVWKKVWKPHRRNRRAVKARREKKKGFGKCQDAAARCFFLDRGLANESWIVFLEDCQNPV
jgi:hypothetical protein